LPIESSRLQGRNFWAGDFLIEQTCRPICSFAGNDLSEWPNFLAALAEKADCDLLLDVPTISMSMP